jgi:hypothetical protein
VILSLLEAALWAASSALTFALLFVLLYKRRYRVVPWFTAWVAAGCGYAIILFFAYKFGTKHTYAMAYWCVYAVDTFLQIAVILEIARAALKRDGRWVAGARPYLVFVGVIAPIVAGSMAWFMKPAANNSMNALVARVDLFTTILFCLLFAAVMAASSRLGLGLRTHAMRESYGIVSWALMTFATNTLHFYWRTMGQFAALEYIKKVGFVITAIYWIIAFWRPEPAPEPITFDKINDLDELATRLEYAQSRRDSSTDGVLPK